jgi:hypothetical protein
MGVDVCRCGVRWLVGRSWLTGFGGGGRVDRDQILRLLGEREAAGRAEVLRLEQEAVRITGLIEECRREVDRLAIASEVLSGLVAQPAVAVPAGRDLTPDAVFADRLLAVLTEAGRPVRCREVAAALGEDPDHLVGHPAHPALVDQPVAESLHGMPLLARSIEIDRTISSITSAPRRADLDLHRS